MGSSQSTLAVAGFIVVSSAAAIYYFYSDFTESSSETSVQSTKSKSSAKSKKTKKGHEDAANDDDIDSILAAATANSASTAKPHIVQFPDVVPGAFTAEKESTPKPESSGKEKKLKKKKTKKTAATPIASQSDDAVSSADDPNASATNVTPSLTPTSSKKKKDKGNLSTIQLSGSQGASDAISSRQIAANEVPDNNAWTRVESRKRVSSQGEQIASDAGITTSVTETSSLTTERTDDDDDDDDGREGVPQENRKTFAERMLPKPRKTGVEDMLETPMYPTVSRVMRVGPGPGEKPAEGFTWGDYEDVDESGLKDSWQESADGSADDGWDVVKSRSRTKIARNSPSSSSVTRSTAPETLTKRQRQNAAKREAEKAEKKAADIEREMALAKHRRDVEKIRIDEQWKRKGKTNDSVASVSEKGSLVWS